MGRREAYAAENDAELLVDGDDPRISTGAATLAVELTDARRRRPPAQPGCHRRPGRQRRAHQRRRGWLRATLPACRVVGIQAEEASAMTLSWRAGRPIDTPTAATYADGIASRIAIPNAVEPDAGPRRRHGPGVRGRPARGPGRAHAPSSASPSRVRRRRRGPGCSRVSRPPVPPSSSSPGATSEATGRPSVPRFGATR